MVYYGLIYRILRFATIYGFFVIRISWVFSILLLLFKCFFFLLSSNWYMLSISNEFHYNTLMHACSDSGQSCTSCVSHFLLPNSSDTLSLELFKKLFIFEMHVCISVCVCFMMWVLRTKLLSLRRGANALNHCAVSLVIFKKQNKPGLINLV